MPANICIDSVYPFESPGDLMPKHPAIWQEGSILDYAANSTDLIRYLIREGLITKPGNYCIVRLDMTVNVDALPRLMWVGCVRDDMTVAVDELYGANAPTRIVNWPPK